MASEKPKSNRVREALGRIYDHYPPYFKEYLRRYQEDPTSRVFAPLAEAYRRMGRPQEAIEICEEGLAHHPNFHGGRVVLARGFLDLRHYEKAKDQLQSVIQAVPENLLAQRLLGDVHVALKNQAEALQAYKMALLLAPEDATLAERVQRLEGSPESARVWMDSVQVLEAPTPAPAEDEVRVFKTETPPAPEKAPAASESSNLPSEAPDETIAPMEISPPEIEVAAPIPETDPNTEWSLERGIWENTPSVPDAPPDPEEWQDNPEVEKLLVAQEPLETPEEEGFKVEHVSEVFAENMFSGRQEITTETLGDLYLSQGQQDKALRIFERLYEQTPSMDLSRKIQICQMQLGVNKGSLVRKRQIELLRGLLMRVRQGPSRAGVSR